jgi:hypothetical protein
MRHMASILVWLLIAGAAAPVAAGSQPQAGRTVDWIVARVEGDIILESQVRELAAFQQLIEGRAESDNRLLAELIEQWVTQTEATTSHFAQPAQPDVEQENARLVSQFASPEAYAAKLRDLGLSATQVRQLLARQIYVERYLDYKIRPSVQIDSSAIEIYYQKELLPALARKNQPAPRRADVEGQIRELLTQRAITDLAAKWLEETKSRLKIELTAPGAKP